MSSKCVQLHTDVIERLDAFREEGMSYSTAILFALDGFPKKRKTSRRVGKKVKKNV